MLSFNRIAILGLGLIGSSLARVLVEKKLATHVAAYNKSEAALEYARKHHFIHSAHKRAAEAVKDADLIIFATPVEAFPKLMQEIASSIKKDAVITDVASVKRLAISALRQHLPKGIAYVPAHPIAGSEKTGAEAGDASLFNGKRVVLTPEESELTGKPVTRVRTLWEKIGAKVEFMPAQMHDLVYAYVSHLPQIAAFAVAPLIDSSENKRFARLTKSDPNLWAGICLANADYVGDAINDFILFLTQMHGELLEKPEEDGKAETSTLFCGLIATCLIATASLLQEKISLNPVHYAGAGFADMTSLSTNDPQALLASISGNSKTIVPLLEKTLERLRKMRIALNASDGKELAKLFR